MSTNQEDFINLSNLMSVLTKHNDQNFVQADEKPQLTCKGSVHESQTNVKVESMNLDKIPKQSQSTSIKCEGRIHEPRPQSKKTRRPANIVDPKDTLREQISRLDAENLELRDSNVKLQRLCKAKDAKRRELKYKISLQEQVSEKDLAEKKIIEELKGTVGEKLLQIEDLKSQIESVRAQLCYDESATKSNIRKLSSARICRSTESYKKPSGGAKRRSDIGSLECFYKKVSAYDIGLIKEEDRKETPKRVEKKSNTGSMAKSREKICGGSKTGTDIESAAEKLHSTLSCGSTKNDSDMDSVLSKLNGLLEDLNGFCIENSVNCKGFLEEAQNRIEGLLARANGAISSLNEKQKNVTDSNNFQNSFKNVKSIDYERSVKVEIFECLDKGVQVSMDENTQQSLSRYINKVLVKPESVF